MRVVFDNYGNVSPLKIGTRKRHRGDPTLQKMRLASGTKSHFLQVMTQEIRSHVGICSRGIEIAS